MLFNRKSESRQDPTPARGEAPGAAGNAAARLREPPPAFEPAAEPRPPTGAAGSPDIATQSFVDASLTIVGDLHSAGDVRIDGRICGNVRCAQLILGRNAVITGTVVAEQAIVRGKIIGTIRAVVVIIQETGHVESEITYTSLTIDDGAFFEGAVHRHDNPLEAEPAATVPKLRDEARGGPEPGERRSVDLQPARLEPPGVAARTPRGNGQAANGHDGAG